MAQFVEGGNLVFNSLLYGQAHPNTQSFITNQLNTVSNTLTEAGRRFMDGAKELYHHLDSSYAARALRAAGRTLRTMWQVNEVRPLSTMEELQQAPMVMQRWVMAEPTIRSLYHDNKVDGYSDTYVDVHPNDIGEDHYDFRRVVDGVIFDCPDPVDDGDETPVLEHDWYSTTYFDELLPEDRDLMLEEQTDILDTWEHIKAAIKRRQEDPTSRFNADMN